MADLVEKLDNMAEVDYQVITVSDLISKLAGLPPMMEVFVNCESTPMFLNDIQLCQADSHPAPFLLFRCHKQPKPIKESDDSYAERLAKMRQKQMQMTKNSEDSTKMPEIVE